MDEKAQTRKTALPVLGVNERMPPEWKPPAPAWSAVFATASGLLVTGYFGTQLRGGADAREHLARMNRFFAADDGPAVADAARFVDRASVETIVSIGYWTSPLAYERWLAGSGFAGWWSDTARAREANGYFREVMTVPTDRVETIFSSRQVAGAARAMETIRGPVREHNYWGSMRQRMPIASRDNLASPFGESLPRMGTPATEGRRIRVTAPENLVVIRSGQDWSECEEAERAIYEESVRPALVKGMDFLRDHPEQTGCCDMRLAQETDAAGAPLCKSFGMGFFLSLGHLERWASSHPTHLAIFARFAGLVRQRQFKFALRLWHEVSVLPGAGQLFEYVNCHPSTGLLPYFPPEEF
jgi:aldoxime dehydratase